MRNKIFKYQKWKFYGWRGKKCSDESDGNSKSPEMKHWYPWWCCSDQGGDPAVLSLVCQPFPPPTLQPWNQWEFLLNGSRASPRETGTKSVGLWNNRQAKLLQPDPLMCQWSKIKSMKEMRFWCKIQMLEIKSMNLGMDHSVFILSSEKYYRKAHSIGASLLPGFIWALEQKRIPRVHFYQGKKAFLTQWLKYPFLLFHFSVSHWEE